MKSKFLTAGLIAAMMLPAAAQAQSAPHSRDRYEQPRQQQKVREANRYNNNHRDTRQATVRQTQQDWRQDKRYSNWRAPFKYQQFRAGSTLRSNYYAPTYRLSYDSRWGLPRAGANQTYVRHYNDLLLVNVRNGKVQKVYNNYFRSR